jgi:transposase-like protein
MSDHGEQSDSVNAICPYCLSSYQVESEDYSEEEREETCEKCGKTYTIRQEFSVETITAPIHRKGVRDE